MLQVKNIERVTQMKYLGFTITQHVSDIEKYAKQNIQKNLYMTANRIYNNPIRVKKVLFNAAIRSLLLYHYTPLLIVGLTSLNSIDKLEANLLKQFLKIPNDITGEFTSKICNRNKRKVSEVIQSIIAKRTDHKVINNSAVDSYEEMQLKLINMSSG